MKTVLLLAIVIGFGGTLAGAHYLPWVTHVRLESHTSVVANGGRAEKFLIRLPADRLAVTDGQAGGLRSVGARRDGLAGAVVVNRCSSSTSRSETRRHGHWRGRSSLGDGGSRAHHDVVDFDPEPRRVAAQRPG
jgi:hypothetical protein